MSLNLFNKYRPLIFADVVGQDVTIKELRKRAEDNNFSQCMYFSGFTGVGKTLISRIIAKSILCNHKISNNPCNTCKECTAINEETHLLNYFEINASNCGIDQMREIEEQASKKIGFASNTYKVFYIDELQEMVSKNKIALKNLLKLIEKPSKNNYFILGSMNDELIPKAIKNRCTTYNLHLISENDIFDRLLFICEQQKIEDIESKVDVLNCITINAEGSLRTAISLLERLLYSELWTEERVLKELNLISNENLITNINGLLTGDIKILNYNLYNTDIINKIRNKLILLYKAINNGIINNKEKKECNEIIKINSKRKIEYTIETLNELFKYPYTTPQLIEFYLIKIISTNTEIKRDKRI